MIRDAAGNLYSTAYYGGLQNGCGGAGCGVVFELKKAGTQFVLHSFKGPPGDGEKAYSGLISDDAGNLYGTTEGGGSFPQCGGGCGTVFRVNRNGNEDVLHNFSGGYAGHNEDGASPAAGLIRDPAGNLYGTAVSGGLLSGCRGLGCGVVFKLDISGTETLLYGFGGGNDGAYPFALIRDAAGSFYGTASAGGLSGGCGGGGCGVVFKLSRGANRFRSEGRGREDAKQSNGCTDGPGHLLKTDRRQQASSRQGGLGRLR